MLISGSLDRDAIKDYTELCDSALDIKLQMYVCQYKRPCSTEHLKVFCEMEPNVRHMFPAIEKLLRPLLISPASSCKAERSFSALRRLQIILFYASKILTEVGIVLVLSRFNFKLNCLLFEQLMKQLHFKSKQMRLS